MQHTLQTQQLLYILKAGNLILFNFTGHEVFAPLLLFNLEARREQLQFKLIMKH